MTDTLRDKLVQKGWVTEFNADTLTCLIEEHYAELAKPVPVSERLPGPADCDADGRCWWYAKRYGWEVHHHKQPRSDLWTHWLPAHALPIPHQQETIND